LLGGMRFRVSQIRIRVILQERDMRSMCLASTTLKLEKHKGVSFRGCYGMCQVGSYFLAWRHK
jgi:hypothetical protein